MDKKGISELIATVLIIGFTVALAAIIITWGGRFISDVQEDVDVSTDTGLACSKLNFEIFGVDCTGANPVVTIKSNTDQEIAEVIVRTTDANDNVYVDDNALTLLDTPLEGFGSAKTDPLLMVTTTNLRTFEVIAKVQIGNSPIEACQAGIEEFTVLATDPCFI